jgi:hypothetical protein
MTPNCPKCGLPMQYMCTTEDDVEIFQCPTDGKVVENW